MNKKAFTLAELLGVIVLLGIVAIIAVTTITTSLKEGREKTCLAQKQNIIEAAKAWVIDNPYVDKTLSVKDLQIQGYLEAEFKNPMTGDNYSEYSKVTIRYDAETQKYSYSYEPDPIDKCE